MKHIAIDSSNHRFLKVQEEVKNLLSIIMGVIETSAQEEQDFEYFRQNATSQEEVAQIQELMQSTEALDKKAQTYQKNIGSVTTHSITNHSSNGKNMKPTFNEIKPPVAPQINMEHSHSIDDNSIER